jgi:3-phosphoshikimate 1-carboxyvinyltransferase
MTSILLPKSQTVESKVIELPGSKSETNRAYIIKALAQAPVNISNASLSEDSEIIREATILEDVQEVDCKHSGTALRFLCAYFASLEGCEVNLFGSARLHERPLKPLVDALRKMGADITYLQEEGFAPINIKGKKLNTTAILSVDSTLSSQFLSALLLIAPNINGGLKIQYEPDMNSRSYVLMTMAMMKEAGIKIIEKDNFIHIPPQTYKACTLNIEGDWSAASYWYSLVSLGLKSVTLKGLRENSLQGDAILQQWMDNWDVESKFNKDGLVLQHKEKSFVKKEYDFSNCPDIAQTFLVLASAKQRNIMMRGIESLKHKESNRIAAMQVELKKFFIDFSEKAIGLYQLETIFFRTQAQQMINTHNDHRIALSFAPLALIQSIQFDDASVINKSYPDFWRHLKSIGIMSNIEQHVL